MLNIAWKPTHTHTHVPPSNQGRKERLLSSTATVLRKQQVVTDLPHNYLASSQASLHAGPALAPPRRQAGSASGLSRHIPQRASEGNPEEPDASWLHPLLQSLASVGF